MRFRYEYRTRDNVRREGRISASSRDAAFASLKASGVRPVGVWPEPGLLNALSGRLGRRLLVSLVLAVLAASLTVVHVRARSVRAVVGAMDDTTRRQPYGDLSVIELGERNGWGDFFSDAGDRFLASYAVPGVRAFHENVTDADLRRVVDAPPSTRPGAENAFEYRQIAAMLAGMKDELRSFLADGGTCAEYREELSHREDVEVSHYNLAERELSDLAKSRTTPEALRQAWMKRNDELRRMGIRQLPFPSRQKNSAR